VSSFGFFEHVDVDCFGFTDFAAEATAGGGFCVRFGGGGFGVGELAAFAQSTFGC